MQKDFKGTEKWMGLVGEIQRCVGRENVLD